MRRSVSISTWKRISSSIRDSAARRANRRRRRVRVPSIQLIGAAPVVGARRPTSLVVPPAGSGRAEDGLETGGEAAPALQLRAQRAAAGGGEAVVARPPVVVGRPPRAGDQPVLLQPLERGVERALVDLQRALRELLDA